MIQIENKIYVKMHKHIQIHGCHPVCKYLMASEFSHPFILQIYLTHVNSDL